MAKESLEMELLPMERLEAAASVLRLLGHPHRLRICELLMAGRMSVNALARHLGAPANAVSQHLNMMKAHGILASEREGKTVYYRVVDPRPGWLLGCIRDHSRPATWREGGNMPSSTVRQEQRS